jgi:hypothetical protein
MTVGGLSKASTPSVPAEALPRPDPLPASGRAIAYDSCELPNVLGLHGFETPAFRGLLTMRVYHYWLQNEPSS